MKTILFTLFFSAAFLFGQTKAFLKPSAEIKYTISKKFQFFEFKYLMTFAAERQKCLK